MQFIKQFLLVCILFLAFGGGIAIAQESPEAMAKKYNIQFPIAELGNCTSFSTCKAFCDSESNKETCMSFAKKKGFAQEARRSDDKMLQSAKSELGCDSESSCRAICQEEVNRTKCSSFAQKHGFGGGPQKGINSGVIQKAKDILGCDSEASCRTICENPVNQEKCSEFAKQSGLGGGVRRVGPGGCNSEESCRSYCEKNMDECRKFGGGPGPSGADSGRRGPGGCNSEESCNAYCQKNPDECRSFGGNAPAGEVEKFCQENPEKCANGRNGPPSNMGNEEFCRQNPDKCSNGRSGPINPDEFCKQNPDKCRPPEEANRRFEDSFKRESQFNSGQRERSFQPPSEQRQEYKDSRNFENREPQIAPQTFQQTSETTTAPSSETKDVRGAQTSSLFGEIREWFKNRGF